MKKVKKKGSVWIKVANIATIVICVFVLLFAIIAITTATNGYNNLFGSTVLAVETNSMDGDNEDSFAKGDIVVAKILKDEQKSELKVGDVITFWTLIEGHRELNTHRIIEVDSGGAQVAYVTKCDNNTNQDDLTVISSEVVALYSYKIKSLGNILLFLQGSTGFLVIIVIPSLLALGYCVFLFITNLKGYNKEKKAEEKEKLRQEILNETKQTAKENISTETTKEE